jgi:hypothetical protein
LFWLLAWISGSLEHQARKAYLERIEPWVGIVPEFHESREEAQQRLLGEIFPGATAPIFAEWFSGEIFLIAGELLQYVHMPYASTYETEIILKIQNGKLIDET